MYDQLRIDRISKHSVPAGAHSVCTVSVGIDTTVSRRPDCEASAFCFLALSCRVEKISQLTAAGNHESQHNEWQSLFLWGCNIKQQQLNYRKYSANTAVLPQYCQRVVVNQNTSVHSGCMHAKYSSIPHLVVCVREYFSCKLWAPDHFPTAVYSFLLLLLMSLFVFVCTFDGSHHFPSSLLVIFSLYENDIVGFV